jgi:metal iron transporter
MNCPDRTDNLDGREGWNQSPNDLAGSTREDFNGIANARTLRRLDPEDTVTGVPDTENTGPRPRNNRRNSVATVKLARTLTSQNPDPHHVTVNAFDMDEPANNPGGSGGSVNLLKQARKVLVTFGKFIGPGFMVSVATFFILPHRSIISPLAWRSSSGF